MAVGSTTMLIGGAVMAAASAGMQAASAAAQADAQDAAAASSFKSAQANARSIRDSYVNAIATVDSQVRQMNIQTTEQQNQLKWQTDSAMASLRVASGSAGIRGNTADAVVNIPAFAYGHDSALMEQNRVFNIEQADLNKKDMYAKAKSGMNVAQSSVQPKANWGATGLQIAGSALSGLGRVAQIMS